MARLLLYFAALVAVVCSAWGGLTADIPSSPPTNDKPARPPYSKAVAKALFSNSFDDLTPSVVNAIYSANTKTLVEKFNTPGQKVQDIQFKRIVATNAQFKDILIFLYTETTAETAKTYLQAIHDELTTRHEYMSKLQKLRLNYRIRFARIKNWWTGHFGKKRTDMDFPDELTYAQMRGSKKEVEKAKQNGVRERATKKKEPLLNQGEARRASESASKDNIDAVDAKATSNTGERLNTFMSEARSHTSGRREIWSHSLGNIDDDLGMQPFGSPLDEQIEWRLFHTSAQKIDPKPTET